MKTLLDDAGLPVRLGSMLGSGGEGRVYTVASVGGDSNTTDIAAKIYHSPVSPDRQEKLLCMVNGQSDPLKKLTAWPVSTLSDQNGSVCGFLMHKAADAFPVHHIYSPAQRKREHPDINWDFLVNTARNTAAAFHAIHGHGHVIGDVNPNLVFVSRDSRVRLIDCDSFQIFGIGKYFLCEVGVPHFTPPELQEKSSFSDIIRQANHDNFGLAVLIFHLLLMGRHPFAGVYTGSGDLFLENAILDFRYAYGRNAQKKQIKPPPTSVEPSILSQTIRLYFEQAFSEAGAGPDGRPTPQDWVSELDAFRTQLRACDDNPNHHFFTSLSHCPWCLQEQHLDISYFIPLITDHDGGSFNLIRVWAGIEAVPPPKPVNDFKCQPFSVTPSALPPEAEFKKKMGVLKKILAAFLAFGSLVTLNPMLILVAIAASAGLLAHRTDTSKERRKRQNRLDAAKRAFSKLNAQWKREVGDGRFKEKLRELERIKADLEALSRQYARKKDLLKPHSNNMYHRDLDRLKQEFAQKQQQLQNNLIAGPDQLKKIINASREKRWTLSTSLEKAALKVAQAEADMTIL